MNKKVISLFVALVATVVVSNAQIMVGGGVGVGTQGGKYSAGTVSMDKPSSFSFNLSPKVGYFMNDDLAIGLEIDFFTVSAKYSKDFTGYQDDLKESGTGFGIGAFARYRALEKNGLSLFVEAGLGWGSYKDKRTMGSTTSEGSPVSILSLGVAPVLSYELSSNIKLEAGFDFLRLGFNLLTVTTPASEGNSEEKDTVSSFGLGLNHSPFNQALIYYASEGIIVPMPVKVGIVFTF